MSLQPSALAQFSSAQLLNEISRRLGQLEGKVEEPEPQAQPGLCRPLVLSGPSGSGKSTLVNLLQKEYPGTFGFSVSHTTRKPREGEQDGVHYHFVTPEKFEEEVKAGVFIEHATVHGRSYGTSRASVDRIRARHQIPVLDIDVQGSSQIRGKGLLDAQFVFVAPPSVEELEKRLRARGTETEESLAVRLRNARQELETAEKGNVYDAVLVNDRIEETFAVLQALVNDNRVRCVLGSKRYDFKGMFKK